MTNTVLTEHQGHAAPPCPSQLPDPGEGQQHLLLTLHFPERRWTVPRDKGRGEIKVLQAFNEDTLGFEEHNSIIKSQKHSGQTLPIKMVPKKFFS